MLILEAEFLCDARVLANNNMPHGRLEFYTIATAITKGLFDKAQLIVFNLNLDEIRSIVGQSKSGGVRLRI